MKSVMSRSPFSRSPRNSHEPTFASPSHSHSHSQSSSSLPVNRPPVPSVPRPENPRHASTMSVDIRGMRRLDQRMSMEQSHYLTCKARENNFNPPVDLRLLDYVSPYDNNLMCPICRCPFVDPVVLAECDHCFCRDCIRQSWSSNATYTPHGPRGDCPSCRTPAKLGPRSATSKILINLTDELLVRCPKTDDGCRAEIKRGEVQDHVNIYCGFALIECADEECELPVRRKDAAQGCLHYGVSCLGCRKEMQKWRLEAHWRNECPDRKVHCEACKSPVFHRDLDEHQTQSCPSISVPCPGKAFGCANRSKRGQSEIHAKSCTFAKLAPMLTKQQERLDEQEAAQKQMSRKLDVLESGFAAMQSMLYPVIKEHHPDRQSVDSSRIPLLGGHRRLISNATLDDSETPASPSDFEFPVASSSELQSATLQVPASRSPPERPVSMASSLRPTDLPEPYSAELDFEFPPPDTASFPPPVTNGGPYASPLHHLLSMHESLRDEMARVSTALSELDGRHSMQILNENLRAREEISYLGAQVGGLQRQVHWLTSAQLQRQQIRAPTPGTPASLASSAMSDAAASASAGVEGAVGAVSTAATALRGAARVVNVGGREGVGMRRGPSEEGRTKL